MLEHVLVYETIVVLFFCGKMLCKKKKIDNIDKEDERQDTRESSMHSDSDR